MDLELRCPYCGETIPLEVDEGGGSEQRYVEDCSVCCRPIEVWVGLGDDGEPHASAARADD